ncbi:MAG: hypothetical protein ACRD19_01980, partial [Terriglobia bacterium]
LTQCAWHVSSGAQLTVQGDELEFRVKPLPHHAPRTIGCWVTLPGSGPMAVRGTDVHFQEVDTYNGWTFTFGRADGEHRELNTSSQEWDFIFPVPSAWSHDHRLQIIIGIPGNNPAVTRLEDLRLEAVPKSLPRAPQAISPGDGQVVSSPAADFLWSNPSPAFVTGYDLEWQRKGEESNSVRIPSFFVSDAQGEWPTRWLSHGRYSWKVRALNPMSKPGPWSKTMHFTVLAHTTRRTPDLILSARHPVFLVNTSEPETTWKQIPLDVRPRVILRIGGSLRYDQRTLAKCDRSGIPVALQVNGPHNIINDRWDRVPLARLEEWAHRYSELKAFYICEQAVQGGIQSAEVRNYMERLIALGMECGRPVFWADADWGRNTWLEVEANQSFLEFLSAHRNYFYPLWKMNGGLDPYLSPAGLLGLWFGHTVTGWGVQPESWYWTEAGFTTLGIQRGYKEGMRQDAPVILFQDLAMLGASAGAEVYSFEGMDLTSNSSSFLQTVLPPLIRMLAFPVIPGLEQVKAATLRAHLLKPSDLIFGEHYTAPMHRLLSHTLGIAYPYEMVPESGTCYWVVFLPAGLKSGSGKSNRADASLASSKTCAPPVPGNAAVFKVGNKDFIFNSRVNWPGEQKFSIDLAGTRITGKLGLDGWITAIEKSGGEAHLWFNAKPGAALAMEFRDAVVWKTGTNPSPLAKPTWSAPTRQIDLHAGISPWNILIRRSHRTHRHPVANRNDNHFTDSGAIPRAAAP